MLENKHNKIASDIASKKGELRIFENNPQKKVQERLSEIDEAISQVDKREPTDPSNRSMYDHLILLRDGLKRDVNSWVSWRKSQVESELSNIQFNESAKELKQSVDDWKGYGFERRHLDNDSFGIHYKVDSGQLLWYVVYEKFEDYVYAERAWSNETHTVSPDGWYEIGLEICDIESVNSSRFTPKNKEFKEYMLSGGFQDNGSELIVYAD